MAVRRKQIHNVKKQITEAHEKKEYRPVVVAIIEDRQGRVLFVQSVKNVDKWSFPQGGIELGEDVAEALFREVNEETGMLPNQLDLKRYCGWQDLNVEAGRKDRRGFTKGKRYFFFMLSYDGPKELRLQESELAGYRWVKLSELNIILTTMRPEKRAMMERVLGVGKE